MKIQMTVSTSAVQVNQKRFTALVAKAANIANVTESSRGSTHTISNGTIKLVHDVEAGTLTVKNQKNEPLQTIKSPKIKVDGVISEKQVAIAEMLGKTIKAKFNKGGNVATVPPTDLKFKAKAPAKLTKEQRAEVVAKYGPAFAKRVAVLGTALLAIKEIKREVTPSIMFWPFAFGPVTRKVKTAYGTMLRSDIYSMMASKPAAPFKSVKSAQFRGYARCRVCGINLGSATQISAAGVQRPSDIVAHYNKHGIRCNLIEKTAVDKTTGKMYLVRYIGAMSDM